MTPLDAELRSKLKFVKVAPDEPIDMDLFPSFLIVGPQRTGTTWLHRNLVEHPQIFMPPEKELYYFNSLRHPENHPPSLPPVQPELSWYLKFFQPTDGHAATRNAECRKRFGEPFDIRARGEGTATYAAGLDHEVIDEILALNPEMRVIVMIRDPIQRAWSHAKKDLSKNVGVPMDQVTPDQFREFFGRWYQVRCGNYTEILGRWEPKVKAGNLFVGQYDDLTNDPSGLLCKIFEFVGVAADPKYVTEKAQARINPTNDVGIPDELRAELDVMFKDELERLAEMGMTW